MLLIIVELLRKNNALYCIVLLSIVMFDSVFVLHIWLPWSRLKWWYWSTLYLVRAQLKSPGGSRYSPSNSLFISISKTENRTPINHPHLFSQGNKSTPPTAVRRAENQRRRGLSRRGCGRSASRARPGHDPAGLYMFYSDSRGWGADWGEIGWFIERNVYIGRLVFVYVYGISEWDDETRWERGCQPLCWRHCLGIESLQFQSDRCIPYDNLVKLFIAEAGLANDCISRSSLLLYLRYNIKQLRSRSFWADRKHCWKNQ